ncbi:hypothetical protein [Clostridiisalibacter paucivorans]|uniref:hypothetical protein n=1 Tax=Clostridiisalibacter paucivorans TaxID=408753 RepID=UPI00047A1C64|nr:hypothetical protein [Clostridiisalibacter paucivorans]
MELYKKWNILILFSRSDIITNIINGDIKLETTDKIGLKVSCNIISGLSERIPNHFVAFNKLIKNAYDEESVDIRISTDKRIILVIDDGQAILNKIVSFFVLL